MRVLGYARVSTSEQQEHGYGLPAQRQRIVDFCREHGHDLVATYEDGGVRGALPLHEREGLSAALDAVRVRRADPLPVAAVVCARFDRLGRDAMESLLAEREFGRVGARVLYAEGAMNGDDAQTRFMRHVMHGISELDKANLAARMKAGKAAKAARGGYTGGRPPTGYRAKAGELVPDPQAAKVVRGIFVAVAKRRWSVRRIARELDEQRALGAAWHPDKICRILHDERYKLGREPLVDARVWNKANAVLAERRPRHDVAA